MRGETMKDKSKKSTYSTTFGIDPLKSTDFGVDPKNQPIPQPLVLTLKIAALTNAERGGFEPPVGF